jgi:hypothetical protein
VLGYLAQKNQGSANANRLVSISEWIFSGSLAATVIGAVLMVYSAV